MLALNGSTGGVRGNVSTEGWRATNLPGFMNKVKDCRVFREHSHLISRRLSFTI